MSLPGKWCNKLNFGATPQARHVEMNWQIPSTQEVKKKLLFSSLDACVRPKGKNLATAEI